MTGAEFVRTYGRRSLAAWEAAVVELAREEQLTPWAWAHLPLTNGTDTVELEVMTDVLSIGPIGDHLRMPLTPGCAQDVCNLFGWLLPTPWLVYQTWRAAGTKVAFPRMPNKPPTLDEYMIHSLRIDDEIAKAGGAKGIVSGQKKDVVVSNLFRPDKVVIFGAYQPEGPDIYDDGRSMDDPRRQPIQPHSNIHGSFFVDYSHGIRPIATTCLINGQRAPTEDVYRSKELARIVSIDGPIRTVRYPSRIEPRVRRPVHSSEHDAAVDVLTPDVPSAGEIAANEVWRKR